jgi:uncharacterized surface protein with fasciclin (FAS1) repeats
MVKADIVTDSGVIHVIDKVLLSKWGKAKIPYSFII